MHIVNPRETLLGRVYWEIILTFSIYIVVLMTASTVATTFKIYSFTQAWVYIFYYQYMGCTHVFDCHVIVLLRLIAISMNALSRNLRGISYKHEGVLFKSNR